jgi:hypothetical protein
MNIDEFLTTLPENKWRSMSLATIIQRYAFTEDISFEESQNKILIYYLKCGLLAW